MPKYVAISGAAGFLGSYVVEAFAKRGDYVVLGGNDADGYAVLELRGTWARQA